MASKKSPTQLSLAYLNRGGWICHIVEKWNPFGKVRQDCFGFGDILAYKPLPQEADDCAIALVQTTSETNFAARKKKIYASPHYEGWKRAGGFVIVHGWGKHGLREEWL